MAGFLKKLSLVPTGLRYKLIIAFVLMSIIPIFICFYLTTNYVIPKLSTSWDLTVILADISILLIITTFVAALGFKIVRDFVAPIVDMAIQAKGIAKGDLSRSIEVTSEDEIGQLGSTLNVLTRRIRENMDELRSYGERTREINVEISKKVLVLSSVLQISNLISQSSPLQDILELIINKMAQIEEDCTAFLMLLEGENTLVMDVNYNLKKEDLKTLKVKMTDGTFGRMISDKKVSVCDRRSRPAKDCEDLLGKFELKNCAFIPVITHGTVIGILSFGNAASDYEFRDDDIEVLKLLAKQIAIAIENEKLTKKAKELSIKDELTGLYNEKYITGRLDEEIKRAIVYQRPCSFAILNIDDFTLFHQGKGELVAEETIKKIGKVIEANVTEVDRVGRLSGDEFAVVMPEKNKKQANALTEVLRQRVEAFGITAGGNYPRNVVTVSGGVSENPLDGATSDQLIKKARASLEEAKARGKNVVVS